MTPVDQTTFAPTAADPEQAGNCMQAAVAALLDLELGDVPHFAIADDWFVCFAEFMAGKGFGIVQCAGPLAGVLGLLSGRSPRGKHGHMVVACGSEIVHDPHPSRAGIVFGKKWGDDEAGELYEYLVPLDPTTYSGATDE